MSAFVGLWVDDDRPVPSDLLKQGWCSARSFHEAVVKLELIEFDHVSLDHDIASFYGNREMTGYDVLMWLVARKQHGDYVPAHVTVHTANPVGRKKMNETIKKHWE